MEKIWQKTCMIKYFPVRVQIFSALRLLLSLCTTKCVFLKKVSSLISNICGDVVELSLYIWHSTIFAFPFNLYTFAATVPFLSCLHENLKNKLYNSYFYSEVVKVRQSWSWRSPSTSVKDSETLRRATSYDFINKCQSKFSLLVVKSLKRTGRYRQWF